MSDHSSHGHVHIVPIPVYLRVYGLLVLLLFITVGAAYLHIPVAIISIGIMLTVAIVKAVLVILYFMHVRYGTKLTWIWAAAGFVWLLLLFGVIMDYISRDWGGQPVGWQ